MYLSKIKVLSASFGKATPYPHLVLPHFFREDKIGAICKALLKESFTLKEADLFKFWQTQDLVGTRNKLLQEFRTFLCSAEFVQFMCEITLASLRKGVVDMAGTKYTDTHYLLPHDDQLEGRKIAYFLYLSDLKKNEGGRLQLFDSYNSRPSTVKAEIIPTSGTFAFFLVSNKSFHQVEEVIRRQRLAISGWFHD